MKSRVKLFEIPVGRNGFGITLRGDCPVYVRSVEFDSLAHTAGVRSGDLILEINGVNVRYSTKQEVLQLINSATSVISLVVVVEGLETLQIRTKSKNGRGTGRARSFQEKVFHQKLLCVVTLLQLSYYFDKEKKKQLLAIINHYQTNHDIDSLGRGVYMLLETPADRRILPDIR